MPAGSQYGREVLVIPVDFTEGQQVYDGIAKQLADLDIGVLGKEWTYWSMSVPCRFLLALSLHLVYYIYSLGVLFIATIIMTIRFILSHSGM